VPDTVVGYGRFDSYERPLALAADVVAAAGPLAFRRPQSAHETAHGDIARVQADFDASEIAVAKAAAPIVKRIVAQLADEASAHMNATDRGALADLSPSYVAELAAAMNQAALVGVDYGSQQILDWQTKTLQFSEATSPKKSRVTKGLASLAGSALLVSQSLADRITLAVRTAAARRALHDEGWTDEDLSQLDDIAAGYTVTAATTLGREAMTLGRMLELAALVAVAAQVAQAPAAVAPGEPSPEGEPPEHIRVIASLVRSEVLDNDTCATCAEHDGDVYSDTDPDAVGSLEEGLDAVPDPDCDGVLGGNVCRGVMIPGD
jgi:hypothetical protein